MQNVICKYVSVFFWGEVLWFSSYSQGLNKVKGPLPHGHHGVRLRCCFSVVALPVLPSLSCGQPLDLRLLDVIWRPLDLSLLDVVWRPLDLRLLDVVWKPLDLWLLDIVLFLQFLKHGLCTFEDTVNPYQTPAL